ncbi:MAG: DUF4091 domain-containing protein [Atopobiaceae bacterium]|jgi:hypothetical protein
MVEEIPGQMCKILSPLAKVFSDEEPCYLPECVKLSGLWEETVSFQCAYKGSGPRRQTLRLEVVTDDELTGHVRVREVREVPVRRATNGRVDDNYLRTGAGMYPDLLQDLSNGEVDATSFQWRSIWVDVFLAHGISAGRHEIELRFFAEDGLLMSARTVVEVIAHELPELAIKHTEWFYADCLADYYHVPVFSDAHWQLIENFMHEMVARGCNMILTPLFTPPLDVEVGLERTTTQLVDVYVNHGTYSFDFSKLERWVKLCQRVGMQYFEMSHLFTQWGAQHPPKIVAMVDDGTPTNIFGWDTPALGAYTEFLAAFLPELTQHLRAWNIADKVYFHISDEPGANLEAYQAAKESLGTLLDGFHTLDAISSFEMYEKGIVDIPVPDSNIMDPFLANRPHEVWTYYCTGQFLHASNRFMAMPSARNRIFGIQCYKFGIDGILHWGYNYYNSQLSRRHIDPYSDTDAGGGFPAGDAFLVYPGANGQPEESIRMMVFAEALQDIRACTLLESLTSKDHVRELIDGDLAEPLTFTTYPKSDFYLMQLRNRINREIARALVTKSCEK